MEIKTVYEFAWRSTQQIVVTSDKEGHNIKGWGSGFFLQYKGRLFLVTADHVSHPEDFDAGIRLGKDDYVWVYNNITKSDELSTLLTPIGGLYYFDRCNLNDELSLQIPDMQDVSFAVLPNSFHFPFLTHELKVGEEILVPADEEKIIIDARCSAELKESDYCLVEGCILWNIKNGLILDRCNAVHQDLTLEEIDDEGNYILKYPQPVIYKYWAGISGAPVFNAEYRLIGMIIAVNPHNDTVNVIPIKKILDLMSFAIRYEENIQGKN